MPSFAHHKHKATAQVEASASVADAPELPYAGASLMPDHIHVLYVFDPARQHWTSYTTVSGFRMLASGSVGRARAQERFGDDDEAPEWVALFVRAHRPNALAHIPVGSR